MFYSVDLVLILLPVCSKEVATIYSEIKQVVPGFKTNLNIFESWVPGPTLVFSFLEKLYLSSF